MRLEEKLEVLRGIERELQEANHLAQAALEVKRAKLHLMQRQHALAEPEFQKPHISVPVILPSQGKSIHGGKHTPVMCMTIFLTPVSDHITDAGQSQDQ